MHDSVLCFAGFPYKASSAEDIPGDLTQDIMVVDGNLTFEFMHSWQCPALKVAALLLDCAQAT